MTDVSEDGKPNSNADGMRAEVERLNAENLLLQQRVEFERLLHDDREKQRAAFDKHREAVDQEITTRIRKYSFFGLVVVGLGLWGTFAPVRDLLKNRLNQEFSSPHIRVLISDAAVVAAKSQTKEIINTQLQPAIAQAQTKIQQQSDQVTQLAARLRTDMSNRISQVKVEVETEHRDDKAGMSALREQYTQEVGQLKTLVDYQEKLKEIDDLKGKAILGDFTAYNKLDTYKSADPSLASAAQAASLESKALYLTGSRVAGTSLTQHTPDGKTLRDDQISTSSLIAVFLLAPDQGWEGRAKAAILLRYRREAAVPDALLDAMTTDANLWVREEALRSFDLLTGYQPNDVFDFAGAVKWWDDHKADYLKSVSK